MCSSYTGVFTPLSMLRLQNVIEIAEYAGKDTTFLLFSCRYYTNNCRFLKKLPTYFESRNPKKLRFPVEIYQKSIDIHDLSICFSIFA